ncbi:beta-N-acetylhexosaminidase [Nitrosomonas eutropha]|uniref:Beta-hexosaminidase n=2 Tax=Nitrosomonas eutropha TaxID=916 RepID=NAGZ_NITEC|nr:beta-N-acetylhexosaminidase [Nitrosomonas eutropha]Q0AF74.1 RecName: Full=Beta-hexosaminidase; AltName: Full=Beta-N-acetylhexosaminidase; AltName: Full=N-acetyl-beta-glucosaminidase [Nitrosomonas eutropha C91]ABI60008.1 glycoside hydrolase, family 3 domain protein [Nitrosomonas eutropha C91]PXV77237.1 beta-N-acetylhexosaminidase [Nitrosomonas eutropha]
MFLGPLMLDIAGTTLTETDRVQLSHPLVGGVILFARNYESPAQLSELTASIHALRSPPLLIAVDQEGGRVQRFRDGFTRLPPMRTLGEIQDRNPDLSLHLARQIGYVLAAELKACGVDVSFTPVLDLDCEQSSVIGDRAFYREPQVVAELAHALMSGLQSVGMVAVGKHFPGHGAIQADTHVETAIDSRNYTDIEKKDLTPFRRMIDTGLSGIMAAHVIYPAIDPNPAGFSSKWLQDILRNELGFRGCIFSDDLCMQAARNYGSITHRAEQALQAGCNMVLICNDPDSADELLTSLQWEFSAVDTARLEHMRGQQTVHSMAQLHEMERFIRATEEISRISLANISVSV